MTEPREPSYYEIALTNRQVMVAFAVLLVCLLVAFFCGVWVGRGSPEGVAEARVSEAERPPSQETGPQELEFFEEQAAGSEPLWIEEPRSEPAPQEPQKEAIEQASPEPRQQLEERPRSKSSPEPSGNGLLVQVFSSLDEGQARELLARLYEAGYSNAFISQVEVQGIIRYRVRVGPYEERQLAEGVAERLRSRFRVDTWITQ